MPDRVVVRGIPQGSDEWKRLRLGIPTGSKFGEIITPKTMKLSASSEKLRYRLLAERLSGSWEDTYSSEAMVRGFTLQPEAIAWYQLQEGVVVEEVSLVYLDETKRVAVSPDGLVGEGMIEVKCPLGAAHVEFLVTKKVPVKYLPQIQGGMWVTGAKWCDYICYHDEMPSDFVRVERDEVYIENLSKAVLDFSDRLAMDQEYLGKQGGEVEDAD